MAISTQALQYEAPPPTTNILERAQRMRLIKSTRKLGAVLGATPLVIAADEPSNTSKSTSNLARFNSLERVTSSSSIKVAQTEMSNTMKPQKVTLQRTRSLSHASSIGSSTSSSGGGSKTVGGIDSDTFSKSNANLSSHNLLGSYSVNGHTLTLGRHLLPTQTARGAIFLPARRSLDSSTADSSSAQQPVLRLPANAVTPPVATKAFAKKSKSPSVPPVPPFPVPQIAVPIRSYTCPPTSISSVVALLSETNQSTSASPFTDASENPFSLPNDTATLLSSSMTVSPADTYVIDTDTDTLVSAPLSPPPLHHSHSRILLHARSRSLSLSSSLTTETGNGTETETDSDELFFRPSNPSTANSSLGTESKLDENDVDDDNLTLSDVNISSSATASGRANYSNTEDTNALIRAARKRKMDKLMRTLGERVPSELVFGPSADNVSNVSPTRSSTPSSVAASPTSTSALLGNKEQKQQAYAATQGVSVRTTSTTIISGGNGVTPAPEPRNPINEERVNMMPPTDPTPFPSPFSTSSTPSSPTSPPPSSMKQEKESRRTSVSVLLGTSGLGLSLLVNGAAASLGTLGRSASLGVSAGTANANSINRTTESLASNGNVSSHGNSQSISEPHTGSIVGKKSRKSMGNLNASISNGSTLTLNSSSIASGGASGVGTGIGGLNQTAVQEEEDDWNAAAYQDVVKRLRALKA